MAAEAEPRARWIEPAILAAAAALAVAGIVHARAFYHDDAYITLRYVDRWLSGDGLTWNDGERVEGFSHPLWMLQLAVLGALGAPLPAATRALGLLYAAGLVVLWRRSRAWSIPLLVVATQPGLLLWTRGGLETVSFAFWITLAMWLTRRAVDSPSRRDAALAGLAAAAAALTRPEGLGVGLVALAWLAWTGGRRGARPMLALGAALLVPVLAWFAVRLAYFHDVLPNPAYVKIGGAPVAVQLAAAGRYLWINAADWAPGAAAVLAALVLAGRRQGWWLAAFAVPVVAALVAGGGDHMAGVRLLVPAIVALAYAAALVGPPDRRAWRWVATAALVVAAGWQARVGFARTVHRDAAASVGTEVGLFLQATLPAGTLVATATAGSTPYFAPSLRFIDTLGLNDRVIARRAVPARTTRMQALPGHRKGDGAYVLSRRPDVVIIGPAAGDVGRDPTAWFLTDRELLQSSEFRTAYRPYGVRLPSGRPLVVWLRVDSAATAPLAALAAPIPAP